MIARRLCILAIPGLLLLGGCADVPIRHAAATGQTSEVLALLDKMQAGDRGKAQVQAEEALRQAAAFGHADTVNALLDRGTDVNARAWNGYTALHQASSHGLPKMVALLLSRGADPELRNEGRWTALSLAAVRGHVKTVEALLVGGAKPDPEALRIAQQRGYVAVADLIQDAFDGKIARPAASQAEVQRMVQQAVNKAQKPARPAIVSDVDHPKVSLPERPWDLAVVVGIEKYSDIPDAQFAERDAEAVKDHLIALGFPSRNVVLLSGPKAVRSALEKYLETWLPRNVKEDSRVFFYFSGHGAPDVKTGMAYLVPWDGDAGFLPNTAYPIERLYKKLGELKAREIVVAMDACFSGAGGRSVLAKGARPLVMKVDAGTIPQQLTVFAAASAEQITSTLEDQGHGTFTYYFLKGLSGAAKDRSGAVTAGGLYDYLKPKVQDAARRQNREQDPVLIAPESRELFKF